MSEAIYRLENRYGTWDRPADHLYFAEGISRRLYQRRDIHIITRTHQLGPRAPTVEAVGGRTTFVLAEEVDTVKEVFFDVLRTIFSAGIYIVYCASQSGKPGRFEGWSRLSLKVISSEEAKLLFCQNGPSRDFRNYKYFFDPRTLAVLGLDPRSGMTQFDRDKLIKEDATPDDRGGGSPASIDYD